MANVTIKRYSGSAWVTLDPATSIAQVSGLSTSLSAKVAKAGDTMSGDLNMGGNDLVSVASVGNASGGMTASASGTLTLSGSSISATTTAGDVSVHPADGYNVSVNSHKITNVGTPTADGDAVNKLYVDGKFLAGLNPANPVYVAINSNTALSGLTVVTFDGGATYQVQLDGMYVDNSGRVLLINQTTKSQNGIYTLATNSSSGTLTKVTADCETGTMTFVEHGTYNDWTFVKSDDQTTNYDWIQFAKPDTITAGAGLTKTGTSLAIASSAALPGNPTTTTQSQGDNSTKIATTAYVDTGLGTKAATSHANAATTYGAGTTTLYGHVMLVDALTESSYVAGKALSAYQGKLLSDQIAGKAPTSHSISGTTYGLGTTTSYGHNKVINDLTKSAYADGESLSAYQGYVLLNTHIAAKAPIASPTFTGTPAAPTATAGTNTTQIATTAFTTGAISTHTALANPHGTAVANLSGVSFSGLAAGNGFVYDGANWSNRQVNNTIYGSTSEPLAGTFYDGDIYFYNY